MGLKNYASIRSYVTNNKLETFLKKNATYQGISEFTDHVLKSSNVKNLDTDKNLMWCREIHKNSWPSMKIGKFYPFYKKNIKFKSGFQFFQMPIGKRYTECNSLNEAKKHFKRDLDVWFSFKRTTKDYKYGDVSIYVEDVEHIGVSVDIVCRKESNSLKENIRLVTEFMKKHGVTKIISHQVATLVAKALKNMNNI
jgi:hypothetical protein